MNKIQKITIFSITISFAFFCIILFLSYKDLINVEFLENKGTNILFASLSFLLGLLLIIGAVYLVKIKNKYAYKTFPIYGLSMIAENIELLVGGTDDTLFPNLSSILLIVAILIDYKYKTGLYHIFFGRKIKE